MTSNTVFGHLALQFAVHPENLATEALCFILQNSPAASRAFTNFIRDVVPDCPEGLRFETQQAGLEESRPDMSCFDNKHLRVVIENKFWAGLTDNQPVTYIGCLPKGVAASVLFVVPEARLQLVWHEVAKRCRDAKIPVGEDQTLGTMTAASIEGGHFIAITSWKVLLDALSMAVTSAGEIERCNDIAQLQGLCKRMDNEAFLPLRGDELTNLEMARRVINLSELPFDIVNGAAVKKLCSRDGVRETNYRHGSGARIRIGKYTIWVGFDTKSWLRHGVSPIWIYFYPPPLNPTAEIQNQLIKFPTRSFQSSLDRYNGLLVPIVLEAGVEKDHIVEDAVHQLRELVEALGVEKPSELTPDSTSTDSADAIAELHPAN